MTQLSWFPFDPMQWAQVIGPRSLEEEGALLRCVRTAWANAEVVCAIEDTPGAWDAILGSRWRALLPVVKRFFVADPEHPGYVTWPWLRAIHAKQSERHAAMVAKGKLGGRPVKSKRPHNTTSGKAEVSAGVPSNFPSASQEVRGVSLPTAERNPPVVAVGRGGATSTPGSGPDHERLSAEALAAWEKAHPDHAASVQACITRIMRAQGRSPELDPVPVVIRWQALEEAHGERRAPHA